MNIIENIDCIEGMKKLSDNSIDSIISDPPYGLKFMGKKWDYSVPSVEVWEAALRVLKPGGHILSFGGTRTYHRMVVNIEDAGFEIRDQLQWIYGSGFPKSLDISKAIDKQAGAEREVIGKASDFALDGCKRNHELHNKTRNIEIITDTQGGWNRPITAPATDAAKQWEGWGTALKPANEPICLARKPLEENTVAENVLKHGTGGINIDGCRIGTEGGTEKGTYPKGKSNGIYGDGINGACEILELNKGRFPANVIFSEFTAKILDEQSGESASSQSMRGLQHSGRHGGLADIGENIKEGTNSLRGHDDTGGASRFFYVAKASKSERGSHNSHPTVKPLELMQYLIKLITPADGIFLDPFCGSGSTLIAGALIGFKYIGFDNDQASINIAKQRLKNELGMFA